MLERIICRREGVVKIDAAHGEAQLEPVFAKENRKSIAGRRGLDPVFMMKVMFLQRLYGLGDKQIENEAVKEVK